MEIIPADTGTKFTSTEFQDECQTCSVWHTLAAPEHQEINGQVKLTQKTLHTITKSLMVQAQVLEASIHYELMYTVDHTLPLLPIKDLINEDGYTTMPFKLAIGTKPSILH